MPNYTYNRESVPVGETLRLEVQFRDSAGNPKDTDGFPSIIIRDSQGSSVLDKTTSGVYRTSEGRYKYDYIVPDGYQVGRWTDAWEGSVDGYVLTSIFDFHVSSVGTLEAVGTTADPEPQIGDEPVIEWTREETNGINHLLKILKARIQNIKYDEYGNLCPVFGDRDLVSYLCASVSEFNATPTITGYSFDNPLIYTTFSDVITQGAYLIGMSAKAVHEAGREFTLNDNGVTVNPPPVSATITSMYNAQLSDYRAKLKEIKRNHRPIAAAYGAGSILVTNPVYRKMRWRKEGRILP